MATSEVISSLLKFTDGRHISFVRNMLKSIVDRGVHWPEVLVILAALAAGAFGYLMWCFIWRRTYARMIPSITPGFFSLYGNMHFLALRSYAQCGYSVNAQLVQFLHGLGKLFPEKSLFFMWAFVTPIMVIQKYEAAEVILKERSLKEIRKPFFYYWTAPILGEGLLLSMGEKWRSRRRSLNSCFRIDILKEFTSAFDKQARELVESFRKESLEGPVDITEHVFYCTITIIFETMFGVEITGRHKMLEAPPMKAIERAMQLLVARIENPLHWLNFTYQFTSNGRELSKIYSDNKGYIMKIIREGKKKILEENSNSSERKYRSLLDVLLNMHLNGELTEDDVVDEVLNFALAGHDTTASSIVYTLYLIGLYPEVQAKLHQEVDAIFGGDTKVPISADHLNSMTYLECVIKESNRIYPAVGAVGRLMTKDVTICDVPVKKGTFCFVCMFLMHHDERVFPDPEKFDPDRFLPENCRNRNPFAYIPFSAGYRNCIGQRFAMMEMKAIIATVLRNLTLESLDPRDVVLPAADVVTKPSVPLRMKFTQRHTFGNERMSQTLQRTESQT